MQVGRFLVVSHSASALRASAIGIAALRGNTDPVEPLKIRRTPGNERLGLKEFAIDMRGSSWSM
jgi:hypothetical protein